MGETLTVTVVEDDHQIRKSLVEMIHRDQSLEFGGEFSNAEQALKDIPDINPDVVIMDIELPGMSGIECVSQLRDICPKTQFMIFTVFEESEHVFHALRVGAGGYILKTTPEDEIISALWDLHKGGSPMSPLIARKVVLSFQKQERERREILQLSAREKEILTLLSEGMLYKEIGDRLSITLGTVKQHLHRIYEKLHVNNKTEAINKIFR